MLGREEVEIAVSDDQQKKGREKYTVCNVRVTDQRPRKRLVHASLTGHCRWGSVITCWTSMALEGSENTLRG